MPYVGSLPQSGWTFTDPTQFVMMVLELGSTGADEISVFQRLLLVKGTNPFRLAVCPTDIPLQARLLPPVPPPVPSAAGATADRSSTVTAAGVRRSVEIPEQAVKQTTCANSNESNKGSVQPVPGSAHDDNDCRARTWLSKRGLRTCPDSNASLKNGQMNAAGFRLISA